MELSKDPELCEQSVMTSSSEKSVGVHLQTTDCNRQLGNHLKLRLELELVANSLPTRTYRR